MKTEVGIGLLNDQLRLRALVVGAAAASWFRDIEIGNVIAAAHIIDMSTAGFAGFLVPLALKRINIDPVLWSSRRLRT